MDSSDFVNFADQKKSPVLSAAQIQEIKDLLWDMASDPDTKGDLMKAVKGDFAGMMDFLTSLIPVDGKTIIAALGGTDAVQEMVEHLLSTGWMK